MPLVRVPDSAGTTLLLMEYGTKPKYLGPSDCPDTQLEDVHNIHIRDDDVILLSYPKSGCHWLWEMTRMLRAGTPHVEAVEKEKYMMEFTPREQLDELPSPRTFNTHYLLHQLPPKVQQGKVCVTSIHLSHSLFDRWGTKDDRATTVLHSSLFSAFRRASPNFNPVHSVMLSSYLFFCLPLLLPPCTVPCRIICASPVDLVLCPYHLSFRFFTVVRRSS